MTRFHQNSPLLKTILTVWKCLQRSPCLLKIRKPNETQSFIVFTALGGFFAVIIYFLLAFYIFSPQVMVKFMFNCAAWKVFIYGVFLVHIFSYLDWIWREILSPNMGKYGSENIWIRMLFRQCLFQTKVSFLYSLKNSEY